MVVDRVIDVKSILHEQIQSPEHYARDQISDYIQGVYRDDTGVTVLLHADRFLTLQQIDVLRQVLEREGF